MVTFWLS
ncbi:hypothetical protein CP02DC22_0726A, partial [Chlamydia psittaci 02DC22]